MPTMTALATLALLLQAAVPKEPAKDLFLHSANAPGVEIRFVDYHWQPALFEAMASGKGDIPEAKRNWVVVRVILDERPLTLEGARLPVGNYALALWPKGDTWWKWFRKISWMAFITQAGIALGLAREVAVQWAAKIAKACRCDQELRVFGFDPES